MSLTLLTDAGNFRAFKILIAAEYNGIDINVPDFKLGQDNKTPQFLKKSPLGKVPVLDTPSGSLFESNAIARYVARLRRDTELTGATFFESAQVDSWIDFSSHDLELPATLWVYPVIGLLPYNPELTGRAKDDLAKALIVLNSHLAENTYLVGHKITLADITIVSALVYVFKFVADAAYRNKFPHVIRWFETCVHQPQFENVIGQVVYATAEMVPAGAPAPVANNNKKEKKEQKPKEQKEQKPKEEKKPKEQKPKEEKKEKEPAKKKKDDDEENFEDDIPKEKKEEHPFKILDKEHPSPFVLDTWKKTYSNTEDYAEAMKYFWDNFDAAGWSIFRGDYNYNEDNKVLFMTGNLLGGFIQRTEEIRKWLFGTMTIRGKEGPGTMKVTAYYLIRGQEIAPLLKCNDDAEYYTWTKVATPVSDADKQLLFDYWTQDTTLEGEPCLDSRCYK